MNNQSRTNFINIFDNNFVNLALCLSARLNLSKRLIIGLFSALLMLTAIDQINAETIVDPNFNPDINSTISAVAVQPDGKILIGGSFTSIGDVTRNRIARLNSDGTLDAGFNPNANSTVNTLAVQPDGKILVSGSFGIIGGQSRVRIARLNSDGSVDPTFNSNVSSTIHAFATQSDGKILIGGSFITVNGQPRSYIARLFSDGTLDPGFNQNAGGTVNTLAVQPDGRILIGGSFTTIGGLIRNYIARLFSDGTLDPGFNPNANSPVNTLAVQPDGKILVGGSFFNIGGQPRNYLARLSSDGVADSGFNPNASSTVNTLAIQTDGRILVGGFFTTIGGASRPYLARLDSDGTAVPGFNLNASSTVTNIVIQPDGNVIVIGSFTSIGGIARNRIARLLFIGSSQSCTYSISPISQNVTASSGTYGFNVITGSNCSWTPVVNNAPWLTTPAGVRTGSGTVIYTVAANSGASRTGTITVENKTFTVNQNSQSSPTYSISGRVSNGAINLSGVIVTLSGPVSRTVATDANGNYQIGDLPPATYIVSPSLPGAAFSPPVSSVTITNSNIADRNFSLAACTYVLPQTGSGMLPAGASSLSFNVQAAGTCSWQATSNVPWIVIANEGTGAGNGPVNYVVQHNYQTATRSGTISVNGQLFTVTQAGVPPSSNNHGDDSAPCDVTLSNTNGLNRQIIPFTGGNIGLISVNTTEVNCVWTANKNVHWITVASNGANRTGSGQETFTIQPLTEGNLPRKGVITVLGREFTVIQTPAQISNCNFALSSTTSTNYPVSGGSGGFNIAVSEPGCQWMAESFDVPPPISSWLRITGSTDGFGSATKGYTVSANPGLEARTGTIIVGDKALHVTQAGGAAANCNYQLSSPGQSLAAVAGEGSFTVSSGGGCAWSATREASASWITVTGGTGPGNGTVSFTATANPNPESRSGVITVNNRTFTVTQAGVQQVCSYTISPGFQSVANTGAAGMIAVTSNTASCPWTAAQANVPWITIISGGGTGNGTVNFVVQTNNTVEERVGTITVAGQIFTVTQAAGTINNVRTPFDFDGDGKADISVFRPSNGAWYLLQSQNGFSAMVFGLGTDKLVPGDYDGDGKTDIAVFREGIWYLMRSQLGFTGVAFGLADDIPVPGDYDGDGKTDIAVFRPSNGAWYLLQSSAGFTGMIFGISTDKPVPADYDGDGKTDVAVNRSGTWYLMRSSLGFTGMVFGTAEDKLVPADYDGDGKADIAVFRPSNGVWYLMQSSAGFTGVAFGLGTDKPVPADYDGDGKADIAVYRNGIWYLLQSTAGFTGAAFGEATDKPIPNAFVP